MGATINAAGRGRAAGTVLLALVVAAGGCSYNSRGTARDAKTARTSGVIAGSVESPTGTEGVHVLLYTTGPDGRCETAGLLALSDLSPDWGFVIEAGRPFTIAAFKDVDGSGARDPGEPAAYLGAGKPMTMSAGLQMRGLTLALDPACAPDPRFPLDARSGAGRAALRFTTGEVVTLDDPRFAPEQVSAGLWTPLTALRETGGGIFFLEPYDPARIPVLFVHGIGGSPRDLAVPIAKLDRTRFQPWVYYYPSGFRLSHLANGLSRNLPALRGRLGFQKIFVVAHSMGGLVSRAAILNLEDDPGGRDLVGLFVTLSSPLSGHFAAKWGLKFTPEPVPSWIDIEPGSDFIRALARPLPGSFPYHLLFGYHRSEKLYMPWSSDSVVTVESQLPLWAQRDAERIWGFDADHMQIVSDDGPVGVLMEILDRTARELGQGAPAPQ